MIKNKILRFGAFAFALALICLFIPFRSSSVVKAESIDAYNDTIYYNALGSSNLYAFDNSNLVVRELSLNSNAGSISTSYLDFSSSNGSTYLYMDGLPNVPAGSRFFRFVGSSLLVPLNYFQTEETFTLSMNYSGSPTTFAIGVTYVLYDFSEKTFISDTFDLYVQFTSNYTSAEYYLSDLVPVLTFDSYSNGEYVYFNRLDISVSYYGELPQGQFSFTFASDGSTANDLTYNEYQSEYWIFFRNLFNVATPNYGDMYVGFYNSLLDIPLLPNFTIGHLLTIAIIIPILLFFVKLYAGG